MNVLLLCAGSARRFYPDGASRPKCLLPLCGAETILDRMLRQTQALGYNPVIGTGCGHEQVSVHLAAQQSEYSNGYKLVFNPDYATTNSIVTLWQMREFISDDSLIINGDVVIEDDVLPLFERDYKPQLLVKSLPQFDDDTYRIVFNDTRSVLRMGKDISDEPSSHCAAFLGVSRVGNAAKFLAEIEKLLQSGTDQTWPTTAYKHMIDDVGVRAVDIGERLFFDIDTPHEYSSARETLSASPSESCL